MARVKLATATEVPEGGLIMREHDGKQVLLAKVDGCIHAIENICTHAGAPLHEGALGQEGKHLVTCPWHEAHFDVCTGKVHQDTDWAVDTEAYEVQVENGDVYVDL